MKAGSSGRGGDNSAKQYPNLLKECDVLTTDVLAKTVGADPLDIQSTFVGAVCRWQAANPAGLIDNTDVARVTARALRLDLPALTRELYVDAQNIFPGARLDAADPANPALVIGAARLPINRNILILNNRESPLTGIVVHMEKTGHTYLPQQAVDLIRQASHRAAGTAEAY